ncbi:MAG: iron ABC transporter permease [Paracoccaceae bacterium]|nr:iron ABC transporter permease [Paracoccaceae bacterium]
MLDKGLPRLLGLGAWLVLLILVAAPMVQIVLMAVWPSGPAHSGLASALQTPDFWVALRGTVTLALLTMCFTLALGGLMAALTVERPLPAPWLWEALLLAPFLLPPYLTGIAWSLLLEPGGYCAQTLGSACAPFGQALYTLPGMAWIMALHLAPLAYLMLRAALLQRARTPALAARVHGAGRLRTLVWIELPSLAPAIGAAALLTFLAGSEEYGVPAVVGTYAGIKVLATAVEEAVSVWPVDLPKAAALGLILCGLALLAWLPYRALAATETDAPHRPQQSASWSALLPVALFVLLADVLPIGTIVLTSFLRAVSDGFVASNFTTAHFAGILRAGSDCWQALLNSVWLSLVTAGVAVAAGLIVAGALNGPGPSRPSRRALDLMATLPTALPGVVVAVGLILFWNAHWMPITLYGTPLILVVSYLTVTFPYALRYVQIGLAAGGGNLNAVGAVHGAGPLYRLRTVTLPLAFPALVGAASVVFALSMRELVTSVMLQPPGTEVVSTYVMNQFLQGDVGDGMAMAVVGVFSSAILLGLAQVGLGRR